MPDAAPPVNLAVAIRDWLAAHPGFHRSKDIAADLGVPNHSVAIRLRKDYERGLILRATRREPGQTRDWPVWAHPEVANR